MITENSSFEELIDLMLEHGAPECIVDEDNMPQFSHWESLCPGKFEGQPAQLSVYNKTLHHTIMLDCRYNPETKEYFNFLNCYYHG